jgi:hypothetical protein
LGSSISVVIIFVVVFVAVFVVGTPAATSTPFTATAPSFYYFYCACSPS